MFRLRVVPPLPRTDADAFGLLDEQADSDTGGVVGVEVGDDPCCCPSQLALVIRC